MGIYNISVSRVCDRVIRFCARLEQYFRASDTLAPSKAKDDDTQELIDYIESALYAAAEHVDDIDSIATAFLARSNSGSKEADYRNLQNGIKKHKRFVSAAANAIKHQQSRIRIFSSEFAYSGVSGCLHGYFIEGVEDGTICPSTTFHHTYPVLSATALAWEIVMFLLNCSRDLTQFLKAVATPLIEAKDIQCEIFGKAVVAAARLPNYTFGEEHPFARSTLRLTNATPIEAYWIPICMGQFLADGQKPAHRSLVPLLVDMWAMGCPGALELCSQRASRSINGIRRSNNSTLRTRIMWNLIARTADRLR